MANQIITHVSVNPDLGHDLAHLLFEDGGKLSVSIPKDLKTPSAVATAIADAVESRMGMFHGEINVDTVVEFTAQVEALLGGPPPLTGLPYLESIANSPIVDKIHSTDTPDSQL